MISICLYFEDLLQKKRKENANKLARNMYVTIGEYKNKHNFFNILDQ